MKKAWSITTTIRNPERIKDTLSIISEIEGRVWDNETQRLFQILFIKHRKYGYGSRQFYNGLPQEYIELIDDYSQDNSLETASEILI